MKTGLLFFIIFLASCAGKEKRADLLLGDWDNQSSRYNMKLSFSKDTLQEIYPDRVLKWCYSLKGDTLFLQDKNGEIQKHIITNITSEKLRLSPEKKYQVDIALINHLEFFRE